MALAPALCRLLIDNVIFQTLERLNARPSGVQHYRTSNLDQSRLKLLKRNQKTVTERSGKKLSTERKPTSSGSPFRGLWELDRVRARFGSPF